MNTPMPTPVHRYDHLAPRILLAGYVALFVWGAISPYDRATWWAENIPSS